jgi:hypothetical protein
MCEYFLTLVINDTAKILKSPKNKLTNAFVLFHCNVRHVQIRNYINDNTCMCTHKRFTMEGLMILTMNSSKNVSSER